MLLFYPSTLPGKLSVMLLMGHISLLILVYTILKLSLRIYVERSDVSRVHQSTPFTTHPDVYGSVSERVFLSPLPFIFPLLIGIFWLQRSCGGGPRGSCSYLADWQVRVFWLSGLVDRPSYRLYVSTITLYGCMNRLSRYTPFYSQA